MQRVPYNGKLFDEFGKYERENLENLFFYIEDKNNLIDLLYKMFQFIPERRITASEALKHPFFKGIHLF